MNAFEKLRSRFENGFHICVGLDSDIEKIPKHLLENSNPILEFNRQIIEATANSAAAYKINFAFYEKYGAKGFEIITETLKLIPEKVLTIADAKRGDIGNTSEMYAQSIFNHFGFDAVTLHAYMGFDSISPFLQYQDKLNFILALTSNPGNADFEKLKLDDGSFLFQKVIEKVKKWNFKNNCAIVFGATNKEELEMNINLFEKLPVLLPGVGSQGGSLEDVTKIFSDNRNQNFLVNVSRALLYSDPTENFIQSVKKNIEEYNATVKNIFI